MCSTIAHAATLYGRGRSRCVIRDSDCDAMRGWMQPEGGLTRDGAAALELHQKRVALDARRAPQAGATNEA